MPRGRGYEEGPPEGAGHVGWPPAGAGGSVDPLLTAARPSPVRSRGPRSGTRPGGPRSGVPRRPPRTEGPSERGPDRGAQPRRPAGSLAALRVTRPEAVASSGSEDVSFEVETPSGSMYLMRGPARWEYQHQVVPVRTERYSLTFRHVPARWG